ncbi:MAG: hypothetical protein KDJ38_01445 [Gammaproteobacteria bacterium]|nr:hypothetical protein [Gammaproteobacteria bacterium]
MLNSALAEHAKSFSETLANINLSEFSQGFIPAFRDLENDETHMSVSADGSITTEHQFDNLPIEWVEEWDERGYAISLKPTIIAGYLRDGRFFTLFDLVHMRKDA